MTDFPTRPDQEVIEAAKLAYHADRVSHKFWDHDRAIHAAIDAYLAKMPRAFLARDANGHIYSIHTRKDVATGIARKHGARFQENWASQCVALVPVKDDTQ